MGPPVEVDKAERRRPMIRAHEATASSRIRTELKWLLLAAGQTGLLLIGLALIVLATE
jgi:hypothetical protein